MTLKFWHKFEYPIVVLIDSPRIERPYSCFCSEIENKFIGKITRKSKSKYFCNRFTYDYLAPAPLSISAAWCERPPCLILKCRSNLTTLSFTTRIVCIPGGALGSDGASNPHRRCRMLLIVRPGHRRPLQQAPATNLSSSVSFSEATVRR